MKCKYVTDKEQFGEDDYWLPPDEFEQTRKGDCEDFAFWSWRQLLEMNLPARIVFGSSGRYGEGHAWVTFEKDGKHFLLEPLATGLRLPRLSVARYQPMYSLEWNGEKFFYYTHEKRSFTAGPWQLTALVMEWLVFWSLFWIKMCGKMVRVIAKK